MAQSLKLGIRELVEFCCRGGDLGYDGGPGVKALQGLQVHQQVQRHYAGQAEAERRVSIRLRIDEFDIELGGRVDLLFAGESPPRIDEIKTVYSHLENSGDDTLHWAQLQCYGACYCAELGLDAIGLGLNRVSLSNHQERCETRRYARTELQAFVEQALRDYLRWHRLIAAQRERLRRRARELTFPFAEFRNQQRGFAGEVYRAIQNRQRLIVEAPTGSGKTISTLFPALKAIGAELCDQVVYLSAKLSGQRQAIDALELMQTGASYLVIQARARSCPCNLDPAETNADGRCRRCIGFYRRLAPAREQLLGARKLDVAQLQATAAEFQLCPFELGLQMLPWVDVVVCDYNYVFDPLAQLGYFRNDQRRKLLLIDELHNLVERARGMYSASLARVQIRQAQAAANSATVGKALNSMQRALDRTTRDQENDESVSTGLPQALLRASQRFGEKLGAEIFGNSRIDPATLEFARAVHRFQHIGLLYSGHHRTLAWKAPQRREVRLLCLNAFAFLRDCYPLFHAVCGFSATLTPTRHFQQALGLEQDCRGVVLQSAFPAANLGVRIAGHIDTRYRERERHVDAICDAIAACYRARPGNYLVFFSAYAFMQQVHRRFVERRGDIDTLLQQRESDENAQRQFLRQFFETERQLGFAILGGRFAEGIDYRGDALIGAIIVGVGLPQPGTAQQLIQQDFEAMGLDGFDHAFRFPGLIRVKQSAGRVIRSERDRGVVILLDRRFQQPDYARHLPSHWQPRYCNDSESLEQSLRAFWGQQDGTD